MTTPIGSKENDILIVEDTRTQAEQLRSMLEHHRIPSRVARDGVEALAALKERKPILVISDINMPEMDGYELCRRIRAEPTLADLPVILLTELSDPDDVIIGLESGADNFVIKPPDEAYLLSRVRYIMANQHLRSLENTRISLEIQLGGRRHLINADRLQVLHLLLSTYESAVLRGKQLACAQQELHRVNETLEAKVRERTVALTSEIAQRKRLHDELQKSEENYRQLFERNPIPMWLIDPETMRFLAVNDSAIRHYGYSREEFLAMNIFGIRPPEDIDAVRQHIARLPSNPNSGEWRHLKKNGEVITVDVTCNDVTFEGRLVRLILANDVTARKQADEQRRVSEERFQKVFHAAPIGNAFGFADGKIMEVNERFCEFIGCARDVVVGRTMAELLDIWVDSQERAGLLEALRLRTSIRDRDIRCRCESGEIHSGLLSIEPLMFGEAPMYLATVVDITDRKALEAQLHRFHRTESVGRLASGIAHDMNNILAPIMMSAPLLRMNLAPHESEKILSTIEISAQRGAALVRQLLIFGRGVEGERRPVDASLILADVAKICRQTFPRRIAIEQCLADDLWPVHGDATQLHQVLLNLAVNARDAMAEAEGTLSIAAENAEIDHHYAALYMDAKPGRYVLFRVSDTGLGIPPDVAERIFDPFFTTKEIGKGTGLGLSIVQGIIRSHGGFIRLESEVNHGTMFEVYIPASSEREVPSVELSGNQPENGHGELVMVVDDEESIRSILRDTLVRHNYRVVSAQDGVEATGVFAANPGVKLVVTDLDMPLMDGVNLARVLRRMNSSLPFVISTGLVGRSGAERRREEINALGIMQVLTKPYSGGNLLRAVRAALQETATRQAAGHDNLPVP